jgi:hypothetical protein
MSMSVTSSWLVLGFMALSACVVLAERIFRVRTKRAEDMIAVYRPVDQEELVALMDDGKEDELRASLTPKEFRERQQMRQRVAFEYLRRLSFNATVMVDFAVARWEQIQRQNGPKDQETLKIMQDVINAGMVFRTYSVFTLIKIAARIALSPVLPAPRNSRTRSVGEINGILAYKVIAVATACLIIKLHGREPFESFQKAAGTWLDSAG